ncbi:MAG: hypothetical protein M1820_004209 [Bogoriella megaspora]|nr:MAG: hypothetical protein M1820_004209 [Bogoriella megaspora]
MAVALRIGFVIKAFTIGLFEANIRLFNAVRVINPSFWTLVEVTTGAIAACLPPLGPLLRRTPTLSRIVSYTRRKLSLSPKQTNDENTHGLTESPHLENGQWGKRLQHEESWSTRSTETRSSRPETAISPLPQVPPERSPTRVSSLMAKDESRIGVAM